MTKQNKKTNEEKKGKTTQFENSHVITAAKSSWGIVRRWRAATVSICVVNKDNIYSHCENSKNKSVTCRDDALRVQPHPNTSYLDDGCFYFTNIVLLKLTSFCFISQPETTSQIQTVEQTCSLKINDTLGNNQCKIKIKKK